MKPTINVIDNFDADKDYTVNFIYTGSKRMIANEISIREDGKQEAVYHYTSLRYDKNQIIPKGSLTNGKSYKAKLRVKVGENEWTEWSTEIPFICLSSPIIVFDNIDSQKYVYNDDVTMTAIYRQAQGELVKTYQFMLMDENKVKIEEFPVRVPDPSTPSIFNERISGLVKGKLYYIGINVITYNGINYSYMTEFIPQYIAPTISGVVNVSSQDSSGQVLIESFLKQLLGTQAKAYIPNADNDSDWNYLFLNDSWVVIPKEMPLIFTRLGMAKASDWVAKLWCKNVQNGTMLEFTEALGGGVHIKFIKYDDCIVCEKELMGVKSRTKSNVVKGLRLKEFYLYIKVVEHRIQMTITPKG